MSGVTTYGGASELMNALVFDPKTKKLSHKQVPCPIIQAEDDIIIKVAYSGICGTDLHCVEGKFPVQDDPVIMGHETSGTVVAVGPAVKNFRAGDKVACNPQVICGFCVYCNNGQIQHCVTGGLRGSVGFYKDGGWAQYCSLPVRQVHKLPESVSLQQGVLAEPLSCIVNGINRIPNLRIGEQILIQGVGIIGSLFAASLHHMGHRDVVIVEPHKARRLVIENLSMGFKAVTPDKLRQGTWEFDVVIDCSGNIKAMELGCSLLKANGRLVLFGVPDQNAEMAIKPFDFFWKELTLVGCLLSAYCFEHAVNLLNAMGPRYIDYKSLGIREYHLTEYEEALKALKEGQIPKAVFKL